MLNIKVTTRFKQKLITFNGRKNMTDNTTLELADVIKALRQELISAQQEGENKGIRFNVNNVEVELETVVGKEAVAGGGFKTKFFVIDMNADANVKFTNASKQKIKLCLEAVDVKPDTPNQPNSGSTNPRAQIHGQTKS